MPTELISIAEAVRRTQISKGTFGNLIRAGKLTRYGVSPRTTRIDVAELTALLAE